MKMALISKIMDINNNVIITQSARHTRTYFQRLLGLMFRKALAPDEALIINPCSSVHTHWMRFAIDVIYVNKQDVVVGIDHNLRPWKLGHFYKRVQYVIELPAGKAAQTGMQVGDSLRISAGSS